MLPLQIAPKPVKGLRAFARPGSVVLLWRAPEKNTDDSPLIDLAGFKIFREEVPFEKVCIKCPKNFRLTFDYDYRGPRGEVPGKDWCIYYDRGITPENLYTYKIHCYNEHEMMGPASPFMEVYYDVPPAAPEKLRAQRKHEIVILEWEPSTKLEDGTAIDVFEGYNIYRAITRDDSERFPLNKQVIKDAVFEDIPEKYDLTYYYTVRAVRKVKDTLIESAPSDKVMVQYMDITPPGVPQAFTAIPIKEGILLKWMPRTEKDFAGFNLYRKEPQDESFTKLNEKLITENSWIDQTVKIRKTYVYGVTSVDRSVAKNESPLSETVEVLYLLK